MTNLDSILKRRDYFANKGPSSLSYGFSSSHIWIWELDYKESWALKNWCFWTVLLKTLESPLDCKEIQPVNPKGNKSWIFIVRTDAEAETPVLSPPDGKNCPTGEDSDAGKNWNQEKVMTENEMVGWHHRLDGHEFEQALGAGDGQGGLVCCSPWGHKESDTIEQLNWNEQRGKLHGWFVSLNFGHAALTYILVTSKAVQRAGLWGKTKARMPGDFPMMTQQTQWEWKAL